jgi:hypothetical protein
MVAEWAPPVDITESTSPQAPAGFQAIVSAASLSGRDYVPSRDHPTTRLGLQRMRGISLRHFELYGSGASAKNRLALELEMP